MIHRLYNLKGRIRRGKRIGLSFGRRRNFERRKQIMSKIVLIGANHAGGSNYRPQYEYQLSGLWYGSLGRTPD